jgi:outer membrane protein
MRTIIFNIFILFSFTIYAQTKWSLDDCITHAKTHNIEILGQESLNQSLFEDITIAKGNYYPDATFNASQGFSLGNSFNVSTGVGQLESRFNSFSLSSSVNIFNGMSNKYKLQQSKLLTEKGTVDKDKLILDISLEIAKKYYQVLFNKEILGVAKEQEEISKQEINRLTKLYEVALKSKSEMLVMESTFSLDKKETITAFNNVNSSLIELKGLLDIENIENFDIQPIRVDSIETIFPIVNFDTVFNEALTDNPLLRSTKLNSEINEKDVQIAKAQFFPRLNFIYSYSSSYYHIQGSQDLVFNQESNQFEDNGFITQLENNRTHYLGFSLTVPIFNRFYTKSTLDKAKITAEFNTLELQNQKKELKNKIEIAINDVGTAKATLEASLSASISQKEAFEIAQKKYLEGYITSYEFLESKSKYIKTQADLINAKYDYFFKIKVLEYYK